jgi:hypothetical protein
MSNNDQFDLLREEYVKTKVKEILDNLVVKMDSVLRGYLVATLSAIMRYYGFKPAMEVASTMFEYGIEYRITMYIDPRDVKKIEEIVRRESEDRQVRIKALRKILAQELRNTSGEIGALLPDMRSSPRKGVEKAGGGRTKIRGKERGSYSEGFNEDFV